MKGDDKEFITNKIESIEFEKSNIETNVSTGITTPEKYIKGIKLYKKKSEALLAQATNKLGASHQTTQRLKKRI